MPDVQRPSLTEIATVLAEQQPATFCLYRHEDVTGASGTGVVAFGARFADSTVVLRWCGASPSTVVWPSIEAAERVHGHAGRTEIVWLHDPATDVDSDDPLVQEIHHMFAGDMPPELVDEITRRMAEARAVQQRIAEVAEPDSNLVAHATQTGWFADLADEEDRNGKFPWQPFLQDDIGCLPLPIWFQTEGACTEFIRHHVVGRGLLDEDGASGEIRPERASLTVDTTGEAAADGAPGRFRKKPVVIEAAQWFKNGDHPEDNCHPIGEIGSGELSEGAVVRYFRHPDVPGDQACKHCGKTMHVHGWLDTLEGGNDGAQIVCPGDWIITGVQGERYPCKPDIFEATYDAVQAATFLRGTPEDSNLVAHARRELGLLGETDAAFVESIVGAVRAFASGGHSGGSAGIAIQYLERLLRFQNLSPLTNDPTEWIDRTEISGYPCWQSLRNAEAFSKDGGKTYWLLSDPSDDEGNAPIHTAAVAS